MTNTEIQEIKKKFFRLIGKVMDKEISEKPAIKALIDNVLACLVFNDSGNCIRLLDELENLIDAIKELKHQGLICQESINKKTETKNRDPNHPLPREQGGKKSR
jgi:hypothetical protein